MVIKNIVSLLSKISFLVNLGVEVSEVVLCESSVLEKASDFVVNVLCKRRFVTILKLKLVDQHSLELFSFLDVHETITTGFTKGRGSGSASN